MLIIFNDMLKHARILEDIEDEKLYITKYYRPGYTGSQLVIEDLGYSREQVRGFENIKYVYRLADSYSDRVKLVGREFYILVNGASGFDLGFSLYILKTLIEQRGNRVLLLVETPRKDVDVDIKARFYSWFKTISILDIYANGVEEGSFKYILLDHDQPPQVCRYLIRVFKKRLLLENGLSSLLDLRLKRYIIPITELLLVAELLVKMGSINRVEHEYRNVLLMMHKVLDRASADLWSIARRSKEAIRGSVFKYKKLFDKRSSIEHSLKKLIEILETGGKYTVSLIDSRRIFEKLLSGYTIRQVYYEIERSRIFDRIAKVSSEELVNTYSYGLLEHIGFSKRYVVIGEDLVDLVSYDELIVLEDVFNEFGILEFNSVPLNIDCGLNTNYIPFDFYEAYIDRSGLVMEQLYPHELILDGMRIEALDIHRINLVNYHGYVEAIKRKCSFIGMKFVESLLQRR